MVARWPKPLDDRFGTVIHYIVKLNEGAVNASFSLYLSNIQIVFTGWTMMPFRFDVILQCGDVELNPGPSPVLPDDLLTNLENMNLSAVSPVESKLRNKHIIQLYRLQGSTKMKWPNCVEWLKALVGKDFPTEDTNWARNISRNWENLHKRRRKLQSNKSSGKKEEQELIDWEESVYELPKVLRPRASSKAKPNVTVLQEKATKLSAEKEELEKEVAELRCRQSPHKQAKQDRREKRKSSDIKKHLSTIKEKISH